jgi:ketosteroid isomerase-like protein
MLKDKILAMERAALDRWGKGDPEGYLEINADEVSYFDPFLEHRLDGLAALTTLYDSIRGKIKIDRDEIINPRVQVIGDAAILTLQFVSHGSEGSMHWNCTEVYQRFGDQWKIVHSHWSFTKHGTWRTL